MPNGKMKNISVIGSGTMGNGIAHAFAQNDFNVSLIDISEQALERALVTIGKNLDRQVQKELISESDREASLARIKTFTSTGEGVKKC